MGGNGVPKLEVHVRRLTSSGAADPGELEVYCPNRDASVAVNHCKACGEFVSSGADPHSGRVFVECRRLTYESERSLRAARRAVLQRRPNAPLASAADRTTVRELMSPVAATVRPSLELGPLRTLFAEIAAAALPVVNDHEEPIGVISRRASAGAGKVGEVMERLAFVLPDSASISQAAALMAGDALAHLPIVGASGRVVGMLSWLEVLRWFAQADGYVVPDRA